MAYSNSLVYNKFMDALNVALISFGCISLGIAAVYFYMFARSQERFIQFWGICWVCYSFSLLFLILGGINDSHIFFNVRKFFDMLNILFLLFGVYSFAGKRIPGYWGRFSLYLFLWNVLAIVYSFELMSVYIPISVFQMVVTLWMGTIILGKWNVPLVERIVSALVFGLWGFGKAWFSLLEGSPLIVSSTYLTEIIFSNILNFMIFIIYLQRAQGKLETAEKMFKTIAENASDVLFFYNIKEAVFSYVTPSVREVLGYSPQDFYSDPNFYLRLGDEKNHDTLRDVFTLGKIQDGSGNVVLKLYSKDSMEVWSSISVTLIYSAGEPVAIEGTVKDITEMKRAEEDLLASKKSRAILLSYISHELKTPITSILGYVYALEDGSIAPEKQGEALNIIKQKTHTLEHLISDLFQLSKLETRQFSFQFMLITGEELASELMEKHYLDIKTAGLKLSLNFAKKNIEDKFIIADTLRLNQVFGNILSNAYRFSKPKDSIKIVFDQDKKGENFIFSITNYGPVIDGEDLEHIFDRFYRVNKGEASASEGTSGLGLTLSKEIVEAHGGNISVSSDTRRGTTFMVTIPFYQDLDL